MPTTPPPTTSRASPSSASESFAKRRRVEPAPETEHASEWESAAGTHLDLLVAGVLDPEKTPTASKTEALQPQYKRLSLQSQRPILRPTGVGRLHSPGKRGASPVKGMDDLERLRKPVQFAPLPIGRRRKEVLPREVHKLANNISNRTISGFVPSQVKEEFAQATDCDLEDLPAAWFRENDEVVDKAEGLSELRGVRAIHRAAIESAEFRRSEPAWNAKVHQPVLDLALDDGLWRKEEEEFQPGRDAERHRVGAEYIATATLTGDCIPRLRAQFKPFQDDETASNAGSVLACSAISSSDSAASGSYEEDVFEGERARAVHDATIHSRAGSKKVDFALIVIPGRGTRLAQAINKMIDRLDAKGLENLSAGLPQPSLSINPTQYAPVKRRPMACIIETKIVPNAHDPQVLLQVGFMIAALHQRMDGFLISSHPPAYITIPVISVVCHDWTLHFACDRGTHIVCMPPSRASAYGLTTDFLSRSSWGPCF